MVQEETRVIQVLDVVHGNSRPHLIATFESSQDVAVAAPIALSVQHYDTWVGPVDLAPRTLMVYAEGEPEWCQPARLGPIATLIGNMVVWREADLSDDVASVTVLSQPERAEPIYPLTDERCPVLKLAQALQDGGWRLEKRLVRHVDASKVYDGRNSTKMR